MAKSQGGLTSEEQENMRQQVMNPANRGLVHAMYAPMIKASRTAVTMTQPPNANAPQYNGGSKGITLQDMPDDMQLQLKMWHMLRKRDQAAAMTTGAQAVPPPPPATAQWNPQAPPSQFPGQLAQASMDLEHAKYTHLTPEAAAAQRAYEAQQRQVQQSYVATPGTPATHSAAYGAGVAPQASAPAQVQASGRHAPRAPQQQRSGEPSRLPTFLKDLMSKAENTKFTPEDADRRNERLNGVVNMNNMF